VKKFCTHCLEEREVRCSTRQDTIMVRGEPIVVDSEVAYCRTCENEVFDTNMAEKTLKSAYEIYRKRHGLLSPQEIRDIRNKYGLSHRALSRLLGWGPVTTQRYEQGALQDEAHDSILRQMRDDPLFVLKHWEKNKDRLSEFESRKLERHLCELCSRIGADSLVKAFQKEEVLAFGRNPGACGFRVFDLPRTGEVVLFFATRVRDLYETKLAKLLWVADFANYLACGKSMTGLTYARLPYGPAPHRFRILLALLEESEVITLESREAEAFSGTVVQPKKSTSFSSLTSDEVQILERVTAKYGHLSSKRLSDMSHRESIWADAVEGSLLTYRDACSVDMVTSIFPPGQSEM
jgi:putative zinc finger/helix-turn-helix YgiT family protein